MDKLKYIKIEDEDGSLSNNIPIGVDAENVDVTSAGDSQNLADYIIVNDGKINSINSQIDDLQDNNTSLSNQIKSLSSGSPKGSYTTVSELKSANPETGVYIVQENGHIYSWIKDNEEAIDLGVYQATDIADNSVSASKIKNNILITQDMTYLPLLYSYKSVIDYPSWPGIGHNVSGGYQSDIGRYGTIGYIAPKKGMVAFRLVNNNYKFFINKYLAIDKSENTFDLTNNEYEFGGISRATGNPISQDSSNTCYIRTKNFFQVDSEKVLQPDLNICICYLYKYDSDNSFIEYERLRLVSSSSTKEVMLSPEYKYKLVFEIAGVYNSDFYKYKSNFIELLTKSYTKYIGQVGGTGSGWHTYNENFVDNNDNNYLYIVTTKRVDEQTIKYNVDSPLKEIFMVSDDIINNEQKSFLDGKTISIIGDSISTKISKNACELIINKEDVGKNLSAYITYYDVKNNLTINDYSFSNEDIGKDISITPTESDIGKRIGEANNYNNESITTWWEFLEENTNCKINPVCWSGSSITSHEAEKNEYKTSYSWHEAQIRKVGIRKVGTMDRESPDIIIIYRGTNDFSHNKYAKLSDNIFNNINYQYPSSDIINDSDYGYKEGLVLLISRLRKTYPSSEIWLCTLNIFKRINYSNFPTNNGINTLPQYNDAIREIADFMGCKLIEFDKDGITFENCYSEGYITDSSTTPTHPSTKGHYTMYLQALNDLSKNSIFVNEKYN